MKLAVLKERRDGETRVAASPDTVKKLRALGLEVTVEADAGDGAHITNDDFAAAGAIIAPDTAAALAGADIVLSVRAPNAAQIAQMKKGAVVAALLAPYTDKDTPAKLATQGVNAFAMEFL
ncbi:MAG: NAD(P)(+) transhydrogenase (Re/Si-specific) subunit alpha, partial [Alphaproteobacteria bacterium]|nr:NAD(P)(+) transhydrogenase (Re/Si-specific) subunit alpha [Alphaproteobacteria bacterium]